MSVRENRTDNQNKNGQSKHPGNTGYTKHRTNKQSKPKGHSRMDNSETLATLGTQDTGRKQLNVRENRRGFQEWRIQRHWQHWVHKAQDENKQNN
jgi:hypothetical protein